MERGPQEAAEWSLVEGPWSGREAEAEADLHQREK